MKLTQRYLKKALLYSKKTGQFKWKRHGRGTAKAGDIAGYRRSDGYWGIDLLGKKYLIHRLIFLYLNGKFPSKKLVVDHINGKEA